MQYPPRAWQSDAFVPAAPLICLSSSTALGLGIAANTEYITARLAQSAERKALNLVVVGSSPTVGEKRCAANNEELNQSSKL